MPAVQNDMHMYASSNISISGTTLCLGPVMYVWKYVQCRLWPQKENKSNWWFCFGLGALHYFWQKSSNPPFLSDNVLAYGFPWYQKHHIILYLYKILYFLKLLLNQGWYWCQRGGWLSSLQHHSGGFLLFTKSEFFDSVTFVLEICNKYGQLFYSIDVQFC